MHGDPSKPGAAVAVIKRSCAAGETERFYLVERSPTLRQVITKAMSIKHRRAKTRPPLVSGYLFTNRDGQPNTDHGFKALWQKLVRAYAPEGTKSVKWFRAHDLRALYVCRKCSSSSATRTRTKTRRLCAPYTTAARRSK
jgi:hypothetical protein